MAAPPEGDLVDRLALARLRQGTYRLLAAAFLPPDEGRLISIRDSYAILGSMGADLFPFGPVMERWGRLEADATVLSTEYVRLFDSDSATAPCPLLESHYRGTSLAGDPAVFAARVGQVMHELGAESAEGLAPDHLSVELEVASALCRVEADALATEPADDVADAVMRQAAFLADHLAGWVPLVAACLRGERSPWYAAAGEALEAFVLHDCDLAAELVGLEVNG